MLIPFQINHQNQDMQQNKEKGDKKVTFAEGSDEDTKQIHQQKDQILNLNHQQNQQTGNPKCPRCESLNTKFCYYNNYSLSQPRYFCKTCRKYWTQAATLRNLPVGGGCRKNNRSNSSSGKNSRSKPQSTISSNPIINSGSAMSTEDQVAVLPVNDGFLFSLAPTQSSSQMQPFNQPLNQAPWPTRLQDIPFFRLLQNLHIQQNQLDNSGDSMVSNANTSNTTAWLPSVISSNSLISSSSASRIEDQVPVLPGDDGFLFSLAPTQSTSQLQPFNQILNQVPSMDGSLTWPTLFQDIPTFGSEQNLAIQQTQLDNSSSTSTNANTSNTANAPSSLNQNQWPDLPER